MTPHHHETCDEPGDYFDRFPILLKSANLQHHPLTDKRTLEAKASPDATDQYVRYRYYNTSHNMRVIKSRSYRDRFDMERRSGQQGCPTPLGSVRL